MKKEDLLPFKNLFNDFKRSCCFNTRSTEMRMAETDDAAVPVLVSSTVFVGSRLVYAGDVVRNGIRVRTQLHGTVGVAGAGKGVSHAVGADQGVYIRCAALSVYGNTQTHDDERCC